MSKRSLLGAAVGVLALGQIAALVVLAKRLGAPPETSWDSFFQHLDDKVAVGRGVFHLAGTLLVAPWLIAFSSMARLGKVWPRLLFVPWGISTLVWLAWVVKGLPAQDPLVVEVGPAGAIAGTAIPLIAIIVFAMRARSSLETRMAARRGIAMAALVLIWSCGFVMSHVQLGMPNQ
jgi:hypothetical protein